MEKEKNDIAFKTYIKLCTCKISAFKHAYLLFSVKYQCAFCVYYYVRVSGIYKSKAYQVVSPRDNTSNRQM